MTNVREIKRKDDPCPDPGHSSKRIADSMKNLGSESEKYKVDLISGLPHDAHRRIISHLPFESVVKTSLLSRKWRIIWKTAYLVRDGAIDDAAMAIFEFLDDNRKSWKKNWALQFNFGEGNVLFATTSPNHTLHLELCTGNSHEPPWNFKWLLRLKTPSVPVCYGHYLAANTFMIRTLHLFGVDEITCRVLIDNLLLDLPHLHLQNLTIEKCKGLQSLQLHGSSRLERLTILDCLQLKCIHLMNSNIQSFRYRGKLVSYKVDNLDSFKDVMLDCRQGLGCKTYKIVGLHTVLTSLTYVACLTLCRWAFEALNDLMAGTFRFKLLRELWWIDYSKEKYESDTLISFVKLCPRLTKLFVTIDANSYKKTSGSGMYPSNVIRASTRSKLELDKKTSGSGMYPSNVIRASTRSKLELVKLEGFESEEVEIALAIELIKKFKVDRVIAQSNGSYLRHLVEMLNDGKVSYKFKKLDGAKNFCKKYCKHAHMGIEHEMGD